MTEWNAAIEAAARAVEKAYRYVDAPDPYGPTSQAVRRDAARRIRALHRPEAALAAPPAGPAPREPFAWCEDGDCDWRGPVASLVPKMNCRICPLCNSTAIIEVGTPEGLSFEEYDRLSALAAPPAGVGAEPEPATWAAVKIGQCPNCGEFPAEWQSGGMPCSECGIDLESNVSGDADGAELWTFDFADQADYDRKHGGGAPAGTGGRR